MSWVLLLFLAFFVFSKSFFVAKVCVCVSESEKKKRK